MDPSFVQNFREYIELSTTDLQTTLYAIIMHETLQYDVIYEKFLKTIENYKISMLNQMKNQLFPGGLATERQKEHILLQQMKNLVTIKIKAAIEALNNETDADLRQKLLEQIGLFNDSLQKIETNLMSFESENIIRRGSVTSRSEFSMILQEGLHHNDEPREMIGAPQMTPISRKFSPYKLDTSGVSKFGLTENKDILNNGSDLQSKVHPRLPAFESKAEPHNIPKLDLEGTNTKEEEIQQESEKLSLSLPKDSQGMSLFDMFDACLNNITNNNGERHKRALLGLDKKEKSSDLLVKEEDIIAPSPIEAEGKLETNELDLSENDIEQEQIQKSIEEIVENVIGTTEENELSVDHDEKIRALNFVDKFSRFTVRRCLNKWRQIPNIFRPAKYEEEEFDLLHGIDGMEEMDNKLVEDPVLKRVLAPIENREDDRYGFETNDILSSKINFYDTDPEPEQLAQFIREQKRLAEKENENKQKPIQKGGIIDASPSKLGARNFKKPMLAKSPVRQSQEKDKPKEKPKDRNTNLIKSPRVGIPKKEAEKPEKLKLESKISSSKGTTKSPAIPGKGSVTKPGLPPSNKENTFANRASPTNQARKSLVGNPK